MALVAASALGSFDQGGNREDLSDVLAQILEKDRETSLQRIGIGGAATATKHEWVESALGSTVATLDTTLTTTTTSVVLSSGDGLKFRIGTLFKFAGNNPEVLQVTLVATDTLTVVRGYGSTSDPGTSYTAPAVIEIISHPAQEDADFSADSPNIRTKDYNYTQVFTGGISVSDTQEAVDKAGVDSEVTYQTQVKLMEKMRELNIGIIKGIRSADAGSDTSYRSMGGLVEFLSQATGNAADASAASISESLILARMQAIYDDGGNVDTLFVGATQKRKISDFWKDARRRDTETAGAVINEYETDFGVVRVVLERYLGTDKALFVDSSRVKVMPLTGLAMGMKEIARTGRARKYMIDGEYTLEVRNAKKAHGMLYNLATS